MRFIVDTMLGTLAKWLRILGYDSLYSGKMTDDEILEIAIRENRVIISRDRELCGRKEGSLLMHSQVLDEQLMVVTGMWPPDATRILTRCLECNSVLEKAAKSEADGHVPEGVHARHEEFWKCPACGKFYWPGTHWQGMVEKAARFTASRNNPR